MPSQMFKRFDNSFTIDRLVEMALIDSPRNRQPYSSRKHATAIGDSSQYGWLPTWSPGVSERFKKRETHFIKKHDVSTDAPRFFYTRPIMAKPRFNQAIIPLGGTRNRELRCPAKVS